MSTIVLKYVGHGSLIEVPGRDLTQQDLENIKWTGWDKEQLIKSGLYILPETLEKEQALENLYEQVVDKEIKEQAKFDDQEKKQSKKRGR